MFSKNFYKMIAVIESRLFTYQIDGFYSTAKQTFRFIDAYDRQILFKGNPGKCAKASCQIIFAYMELLGEEIKGDIACIVCIQIQLDFKHFTLKRSPINGEMGFVLPIEGYQKGAEQNSTPFLIVVFLLVQFSFKKGEELFNCRIDILGYLKYRYGCCGVARKD